MTHIIVQYCTECGKFRDSKLRGKEMSPIHRGCYVIGECMTCKTINRHFIEGYEHPALDYAIFCDNLERCKQ